MWPAFQPFNLGMSECTHNKYHTILHRCYCMGVIARVLLHGCYCTGVIAWVLLYGWSYVVSSKHDVLLLESVCSNGESTWYFVWEETWRCCGDDILLYLLACILLLHSWVAFSLAFSLGKYHTPTRAIFCVCITCSAYQSCQQWGSTSDLPGLQSDHWRSKKETVKVTSPFAPSTSKLSYTPIWSTLIQGQCLLHLNHIKYNPFIHAASTKTIHNLVLQKCYMFTSASVPLFITM